MRHELGHLVHHATHDRKMWRSCSAYNLNGGEGHTVRSCEHGYSAMIEGMATFFAVRSMVFHTNHTKSAFYCSCPIRNSANVADQDQCSSLALNMLPNVDPDRQVECTTAITGAGVVGIGDNFATTKDHCIQLNSLSAPNGSGCACPDTNGDGFCDNTPFPQLCFDKDIDGRCDQKPTALTPCVDADSNGFCDGWEQLGFRNEINFSRFMWDVIDDDNENGQDNTNESASSIVGILEDMPCYLPGGFDVNGDCNEPNRADPDDVDPDLQCNASLDFNYPAPKPPPATMKGSRDSYNAYDIGLIVPGSQSTERAINCVEWARD